MSISTDGSRPPTRQQKAAATRRRIRTSALALFTEDGYAATSMQRIADHAGVAIQTTHYTFGTKLALLKEILDVSVAGDDDPVPTLERPWITEALAADPSRQIAIQTRAAREISERTAPVLHALRGAATADTDAAELWRTNRAQFRTVQHHLIGALAQKTTLRHELTTETGTDIAVTILGVDTYTALVTESGWPPEHWEHWATDVLTHQLLLDQPPRRR